MSQLISAAEIWIGEGSPRMWPCTHLDESGLEALFFESLCFAGRKTRVFAWLGLPDGASAGEPVPGIVLVHGGWGTAFARWVRWWNQRGYAAIAMDTCGAMPLPDIGARGSGGWPRHSYGGPAGWGGFDQGSSPVEDQWSYHASAAVVKAHSLLAARSEVDADRIGMTGVSWGGYLTCLVAGLDPRFRAAAPVYGCGFVSEESTWTENGEFDRLSEAEAVTWRENFDPGRVLYRAALPMLWLNGTNDFAYWPSVWQKSAAATAGPRQLCMKLRWPHGHIPEAEQARELAHFFAAHLAAATPMLSVSSPRVEDGRIVAAYGDERPLAGATLIATPDRTLWPTREWFVLPAEIDAASRQVSALLPSGVSAAYLNLLSVDWLSTSSDLLFF